MTNSNSRRPDPSGRLALIPFGPLTLLGTLIMGSLGLSGGSASAQFPRPVPPMAVPPVTAPGAAAPSVPAGDLLQEFSRQFQIAVLVGEQFANRIVEVETVDEGPVDSFDQGVAVRGRQRTVAVTTFDAVADANVGRFQFLLKGTTKNQLTAYAQQATVQLDGTSQFELSKQVDFDGRTLVTRTPAAYMTINQRPISAMTPVSGIPVIGRIATRTVLSVVEQRRPSTERLTAQRVTQQVAPRFNSEVDGELYQLNNRLAAINERLQARFLKPEFIRTRSTDDAILFAASFRPQLPNMAATNIHFSSEVTEQPLPPADPFQGEPVLPSPGRTQVQTLRSPWVDATRSVDNGISPNQLMVVVHESIVEDVVRRLGLPGRPFAAGDLQRLFGMLQESSPSDDAPQGTIVLDAIRPVTARFAEGEILIELRFSVKMPIGADIPTQIATLAFTPILKGEQVQVRTELRSIVSAAPDDSGVLETVLAPMIRQKLEQGLQNRTIPASIAIPHRPGQTGVRLFPRSLSVALGRFTICYEAIGGSSQMTGLPSDSGIPGISR